MICYSKVVKKGIENKNYKNILLFKLIERSREERKTYKANRVPGGADPEEQFQLINQENLN